MTVVVLLSSVLASLPLATPLMAEHLRATQGGDLVFVLDAETGLPVALIAGGRAADPDGRRVYVTDRISGTITEIDATCGSAPITVPVDRDPSAVAVTPSGERVYVVNRYSDTLSVIDSGSLEVVREIDLLPHPDQIAVSPSGGTIYVTHTPDDPGTVSVIDDETGTVRRTVRVQARPNRITVSPEGLVYLTHRRSWNVSVLDGEAGRVLTTIRLAGEPWGIAANPGGATVYVPTLAGNVNVIDTASNRVRGKITIGGKAYDMAISPNASKGYVIDLFRESAAVLDLTDEQVVAGISFSNLPHYSAITGTSQDCAQPPHDPYPARSSAPGSTRRPRSTPPGTVVFTSGPAYPGRRQRLEASLRADRVPIAGLQVDVHFEPEVMVLAGRDGRPLCVVNPTLGKESTAFAFQPPGCTPGEDCTAVRVFVLSVAGVDPIPDRPYLFGCTLGIATDAVPGRYEVGSTAAIGSTPDGRAVELRAFPDEVEVLSPGGGSKAVFAGGSDHPSGSLCAGGSHDGSPCESDGDCPAGACTWAQGVCDGGRDDGLLCDCHDWWTCRYSICDRADCIGTQRICAAGIAKGLACLRDSHCGGERCVSTGKVCVGGDFDSYACVDHSDCPLGSCSVAAPSTVAAETTPTAPQVVRGAGGSEPAARIPGGGSGCSVGSRTSDGGVWLLAGLLALLARRYRRPPAR